jgi:hypothetical protein
MSNSSGPVEDLHSRKKNQKSPLVISGYYDDSCFESHQQHDGRDGFVYYMFL